MPTSTLDTLRDRCQRVGRFFRRSAPGTRAVGIVVVLTLTLSIAILSAASTGTRALAQPLESLQEEQQSVQQQLGDHLRATDQLERQENEARDRLRKLRDTVTTTDILLEDVEFRLDRAKQRLVLLQRTLARSLERLAAQKTGTIARLRVLQRQRPDRWWALLLSSRDWNEFLDRRYYFKLLYASDRRRLSDYRQIAEQVERDREAAEAQKNEIALLALELATQKQELEAQVKAQEELIARITSERVAYNAALERLSADSARIARLIRQLIRSRAAESNVLLRDSEDGLFQHPVLGPITSSFGWRIHPIFGTGRMHSGIDYGVSTGTAVRAVEKGTVIYAGWYGGYGNTAIVYHGNDLTTLYAHNSQLAVPLGTTVERGQVLAFSGSTGLSTGPHVHFEVRLRGNPIDPTPFF
ncbi:MAG: peptidoglycan DD-metalloendopeptidase family protein [Cyanobacteria bacterium J06639_1]